MAFRVAGVLITGRGLKEEAVNGTGGKRGIRATVLWGLEKMREQGVSERESVPNPPPLDDRSMSSELDPIPPFNFSDPIP